MTNCKVNLYNLTKSLSSLRFKKIATLKIEKLLLLCI